MFGKRPKRIFELSTLPLLDLRAGPVAVEISYLANEAHTNAFVGIFEKLLVDNESVFSGFALTDVNAKHPIQFPDVFKLPVPFTELAAKSQEIALGLYMSGNDEVVLYFKRGPEVRRLLVAFDDPYFSLS
jgi:hypothetical protein